MNFASASRKIIGTLFGKLRLEGLERVGDPEELLPGGVRNSDECSAFLFLCLFLSTRMNPSLSLSGVAMNEVKIKQNKIWSSNQRNNKWHRLTNNLAVSLVIKILRVCYKKHPYHSYVFLGWLLLLSSGLMSTDQERVLSCYT